MTHLTAGDILPLYESTEPTYGDPTGGVISYYADLKGDGGSFTPTDNPNMYVAWRHDSRAFNMADNVPTCLDAGYSDVVEAMDAEGWEKIIKYAIGDDGTTAGTPRLKSRTTTLPVKVSSGYSGLIYAGCKTDRLEIRADQPGGIVEFDETVLAANSHIQQYPTRPFNPPAGLPALQWVNGVTVGSAAIYPQSFRISINNNLGRVRGWDEDIGASRTVGLPEGRLEMEMEMDVWREDLAEIAKATSGVSGANMAQTIVLTIGTAYPKELHLYATPMLDGQFSALIQDKQMETLRFRIESLYLETPESS